jgi:hypothetical protein
MTMATEGARRYAAKLMTAGLCVTCRTPHNRKTRRCEACTKKAVAGNRRIKQKAHESDVCPECRKPWIGTTKRCPECKAISRAKWKGRADGALCARCFRPKDGHHKACSECRTAMRAISMSRRATFAKEGRCVQCGIPKTDPGLYCRKCTFRAAARRWLGSAKLWIKLVELFDAQEGRCAYTGEPLVIGGNASLDHKIPRSRGGTNTIENVQWVTWKVNRVKTDMTHDEFIDLCKIIISYQVRRSSVGKRGSTYPSAARRQ